MDVHVHPATPQRWTDVVAVLGGPRRGPDSCWCQRFRRHDEPHHQDALRAEIESATVPVGVLAYAGDQPVGWSRAVPRSSLPGVLGNAALQRLLEADDSAWWVTCCVVSPEHRGRGVGVALLTGAAAHARQNGASLLDGHPVDVARSTTRPSPAALFTGTLSSFLAAGFHEVGRTYPSRPVMRRQLR